MKPLTEKQAWLFIAKEFEKKRSSYYNVTGLCGAVIECHWNDVIDMWVRISMMNRIAGELLSQRIIGYLWECTPSNKPKRAKLARRFAKECEG